MSSTTLIKNNNGVTQVPLQAKFLGKRCVSISGEINEESAVDFTDKILDLNLESNEPITVLINSNGGEINSGLLMYDAKYRYFYRLHKFNLCQRISYTE